MKIGVCMKQVPASDSRIKIGDPSSGIDTSEVKWEINPYDEYALEAALRLVDAKVAKEVIVFTVGAKDSEARMREALARGAHRAVRVDDAALSGSDCLGIARALSAAIAAEDVSLVFAGKQAIDGDNAQVPAMVAEMLGWAQATTVTQLELEGESLKVWRSTGGGDRAVLQMSLPAVLTCDKGLNEPRYASLKGIMMAKRKKIAVQDCAALGLDAGTVGAGAALVSESAWSLPPARPAGRMVEGEPAHIAAELVRLLREEAKVL